MGITAIYAALAAFAMVYLSVRVIRLRRSRKVSVGHGGDPALERAMRLHGNFIEYVPLLLVLLGIAELQGLPGWGVHLIALVITAGRVMHFIGFRSAEAPGLFRVLGMVCTFTTLLLLGVVLLAQQVI